jgi:hypothetical protein
MGPSRVKSKFFAISLPNFGISRNPNHRWLVTRTGVTETIHITNDFYQRGPKPAVTRGLEPMVMTIL